MSAIKQQRKNFEIFTPFFQGIYQHKGSSHIALQCIAVLQTLPRSQQKLQQINGYFIPMDLFPEIIVPTHLVPLKVVLVGG